MKRMGYHYNHDDIPRLNKSAYTNQDSLPCEMRMNILKEYRHPKKKVKGVSKRDKVETV